MNERLIRYLLDHTGNNPDNLVRDEPHLLSSNRIRAISPNYGAFFSDSVKVFDNINKVDLIKDVDYCSAALLQTETLEVGKAISSVILILNESVSNNVKITYQVLGDSYQRNNVGLNILLDKDTPTELNNSFKHIEDLPKVFKPAFHKHDVGDIYGFEYVVFLLERIRLALLWKDFSYYRSLTEALDDLLDSLMLEIIRIGDDTFHSLLTEFRHRFRKDIYGLEFVKNYGLIDTEETSKIFKGLRYDKISEAYFNLSALNKLKEEIYSYAVSSRATYLGISRGIMVASNLNSLANAVNGTVFLIDSLILTQHTPEFNVDVYPDSNKRTTSWSIKKITNNLNDRGGVFLATSIIDGETYIGKLTVNALNELNITWKRLLNNVDLSIFDTIEDHLVDFGNPHKDHKSRLKLGNVENLPLATREEVTCNMPVRKYITFDTLMLFMKRFMTGEKDSRDIDLVETETNTMRRMQAIFSPCGPCDTRKDEWNLVDECEVQVPGATFPTAQLDANKREVSGEGDFARLLAYVNDTKPNSELTIKLYRRIREPEPELTPPPAGTLVVSFCDGDQSLIGTYSDGVGGFYNELIEELSEECGYVEITTEPPTEAPSTEPPETHPPRGTFIEDYCDGTTLMTKFADGTGGFFTTVKQKNSPECGYTMPPTPSATPTPTNTPPPTTVPTPPPTGTQPPTPPPTGMDNYILTWIDPSNDQDLPDYIGGLMIVGSGISEPIVTYNPNSTRIAVVKDNNGNIVRGNQNAALGEIVEVKIQITAGQPVFGHHFSLVNPVVFNLIKDMVSAETPLTLDRGKATIMMPPMIEDTASIAYRKKWGYVNEITAFADVKLYAEVGIRSTNNGIRWVLLNNTITLRKQLNILPMENGGRYDGGRTTPEWPGYSPEV